MTNSLSWGWRWRGRGGRQMNLSDMLRKKRRQARRCGWRNMTERGGLWPSGQNMPLRHSSLTCPRHLGECLVLGRHEDLVWRCFSMFRWVGGGNSFKEIKDVNSQIWIRCLCPRLMSWEAGRDSFRKSTMIHCIEYHRGLTARM